MGKSNLVQAVYENATPKGLLTVRGKSEKWSSGESALIMDVLQCACIYE